MVHRCSLDYHTLAEPVLRAEQRERSSSRGEVGLEVVHVLGLHIPSVLTCGSAHLNTRVCLKHGSIIAYRLENVCMWPKSLLCTVVYMNLGTSGRLYPFPNTRENVIGPNLTPLAWQIRAFMLQKEIGEVH